MELIIVLESINISENMLTNTFSITTIILTVFSIISSFINIKIVGIKPFKLKRYKISLIYLPLLFHVGYMWLAFLAPFWRNEWFIMIESTIILLYVAIDSYFILEPYYNEKHFKDSLIKRKVKEMSKENNSQLLLDEIKKDLERTKKNIAENEKDAFLITNEDVLNYIDKLFPVILKKENPENIELELLNNIQELNGNTDLFLNNPLVPNRTKLEFYRINRNNMSYKFYKKEFNLLYDIWNENKDKINKKQSDELQIRSEYLLDYKAETIKNVIFLEYFIRILFEEDWNLSDVPYLCDFFKLLYRISKSYDLTIFNPYCKERLFFIGNYFDNKVELDEKKFGEKFSNLIEKVKTNIEKGG